MTTPSLSEAVEAARVAREAGKLRLAQRAVDHAYGALTGREDRGLLERLGLESDFLARSLGREGALLAALSEWLRASSLGLAEARRGVAQVCQAYERWRPKPGTIGAPRDSLRAAASGPFWIDRARRGIVLALEGGITGEGTEAFGRVLELCAREADWLLIDMERLTYVGSAGLAVAVKTSEVLRARRGGLVLFAMAPNLRLLVDTLGLSQFLNPAPDVAGALTHAVGS